MFFRQSALVLRRSTRSFATAAAPTGEKEVNVAFEIGAGLGLGLITAGIWKLWANSQFAKLDAFNAKLKAASKSA